MKQPLFTPERLAERIRTYCKSKGVSPTRFGIDVANDPNLVGDLELGRNLGMRLYAKITAVLSSPPNTEQNQTGE